MVRGLQAGCFSGESKNLVTSYKLKVGENQNSGRGKSWRRCNGSKSQEQGTRGKENQVERKTEIVRQRGNCTSLSYPVMRPKAVLCEGRGCAYFKTSPPLLSLQLQEESEAFSHELPLNDSTAPGCPAYAYPDFLSSMLSRRDVPVSEVLVNWVSLFPLLKLDSINPALPFIFSPVSDLWILLLHVSRQPHTRAIFPCKSAVPLGFSTSVRTTQPEPC